MHVKLREPGSDDIKEVKLGFSWTTLFFWSWVPFLRGDFKWWLILLVLRDFTNREGFFVWTFFWNREHTAWMTFSLFGTLLLIFPFLYNRIYLYGLLRRGYEPVVEDYFVLKERGILDSRFLSPYWNWVELGLLHSLGSLWLWFDQKDIRIIIIANLTLGLVYLLVKRFSGRLSNRKKRIFECLFGIVVVVILLGIFLGW